jgi:hypothetical protein
MKSKLLAEKFSALVKVAEDFKDTVERRKPYLDAKVKRIKLSLLKELKELGVVDKDEFQIEAKKTDLKHEQEMQ